MVRVKNSLLSYKKMAVLKEMVVLQPRSQGFYP